MACRRRRFVPPPTENRSVGAVRPERVGGTGGQTRTRVRFEGAEDDRNDHSHHDESQPQPRWSRSVIACRRRRARHHRHGARHRRRQRTGSTASRREPARFWSRRRVVLSTFANRYVRAIARLEPQDCTSGFRCWRRDALLRLPLDRIASNGYAFQVEMAWEATVAGCRIVEVPITFVERRQGVSKLSWGIMLESMLLPWRLAARRAVH